MPDLNYVQMKTTKDAYIQIMKIKNSLSGHILSPKTVSIVLLILKHMTVNGSILTIY